MSRLMSVAFTEPAVVERRKTVTRRKGWQFLKTGDHLTLVRKAMGRRRADGTIEPLVRLAEVEVVSVRREPLFHVMGDGELTAEGFPEWESDHDSTGANEFMRRYFVPQGIKPYQEVTRIEWRYLDNVVEINKGRWAATCNMHDFTWYLERSTRHLARRSLNAHLRAEHGISA